MKTIPNLKVQMMFSFLEIPTLMLIILIKQIFLVQVTNEGE